MQYRMEPVSIRKSASAGTALRKWPVHRWLANEASRLPDPDAPQAEKEVVPRSMGDDQGIPALGAF